MSENDLKAKPLANDFWWFLATNFQSWENRKKEWENKKKSEARGKNKIALFAKSGLVTESLSFHVFQPK